VGDWAARAIAGALAGAFRGLARGDGRIARESRPQIGPAPLSGFFPIARRSH
jgi:hypothetical protein